MLTLALVLASWLVGVFVGMLARPRVVVDLVPVAPTARVMNDGTEGMHPSVRLALAHQSARRNTPPVVDAAKAVLMAWARDPYAPYEE